MRGLLAAVAIPAAGQDQAPKKVAADCSVLPFAQQLDVTLVRSLARTPPAELLARIAALDIDVLRVTSTEPDRPANPLLAHLPTASTALIVKAGFSEGMQGRAIPRQARIAATSLATRC